MRAEAGAYHRRGLCPIPVKDRSKQTSLRELAPYLGRRATRAELASWSWPGIGIVTGPLSGVLVLDVDGPEGEAELKKHGHPVTPMVSTAGGGLHLYFKHPEADVRTGIRVAPGLDVKASGGYVVAPPSVGPNGEPYEWIVGLEEAEPAEVPEWLMALIEGPRRNGTAPPVGERIPSGRRNQDLASLGGSMRRRGMGEAEILAALSVANEQRCDPPLGEEEIRKIAASVARYEPAGEVVRVSFNGHRSTQPPARFNLTDLGNAERLVARHGKDVRYCHAWDRWFVWEGRRWIEDRIGRVRHMARETVRQIGGEAPGIEDSDERKALLKWAIGSEAKGRIDAMIGLAEAEQGVPIAPETFDEDPWKLNCLNGTVDLKTATLLPHNREDHITKLAPVEYDPNARSEVWERHLESATSGDPQLASFLQRAAGYSLTGDVSEEVLFFVHGPAAAGKSTFLEALKATLGDYATTADFEAFLARREAGGARNDIARLAGARLVASIEVDEGKRLAEGLVKMLTGGDTITARFLYKEAFEFLPTFKLWLAANHAPRVRDDDEAMWRRILRVPFDQVIPKGERDPTVKKVLRDAAAAGPAILAWAVEGCLAWQREGLGVPPSVEEATQEYRDEMDPLRDFLEDCCILGPDAWVPTGDLRQAYETWARDAGESSILRGRQFTDRLKARGFEAERRHAGRGWRGLGLLLPSPRVIIGASRDASDAPQKSRKPSESTKPVTHHDAEIGNSLADSVREEELSKMPSRPDTRHAEMGSASSRTHAPADVAKAAREIGKTGSGPAKMLAAYLEKPNRERLTYLTRAVLVARGEDPEGWEGLAGAVEVAAANPDNHPIGCECGGCE